MSKPVFVLLHGAWHSPRCWDGLIKCLCLSDAGYSAIAPALPSTCSSPPAPDWEGDIAIIRETISGLVREHDVVVVPHSFSGMIAGTSLEGLDKEACKAKGMKGGVIRLIYIHAFLVPEGFQHSPRGTRDLMVPEMHTDLEAGIVTVEAKDAKDMFYQDMDDDTVAELAKDLLPQSFGAFWCTTTYAAWRVIPTTYILCVKDKPSSVAAAQHLVDTAKASGPHQIDGVIKADAGHSPFLSKLEWTAGTLITEANRQA
ncbi:alpha/beta-hydrolase [Xylariomycetidae sp. FL0641]|nr:alpha/beta-hydrolase [Xylariomycetidae sp. FL0641]